MKLCDRLGSSLRSTSELRGLDVSDDLTPQQFRALIERLESQLATEKRMVKQLRAHAVATSVRIRTRLCCCASRARAHTHTHTQAHAPKPKHGYDRVCFRVCSCTVTTLGAGVFLRQVHCRRQEGCLSTPNEGHTAIIEASTWRSTSVWHARCWCRLRHGSRRIACSVTATGRLHSHGSAQGHPAAFVRRLRAADAASNDFRACRGAGFDRRSA